MGVIERGNVIEGGGQGMGLTSAGAPVAGTNEVQTLTIGGTPTGGLFYLNLEGAYIGPVTWVNVNATLIAALQSASDAALGAGQVVWAVGTMTAGIGTATATFSGVNYAKRALNVMTVAYNGLTGTNPTLAVAETTPGVTATGRNSEKGTVLTDTAAGKLYINTGTPQAPTWVVVGTQT